MKRVFSLLLLICAFGTQSKAQSTCGQDKIHESQLALNPAYQQAIADAKTNWNNFVNSPARIAQVMGNDTIYEVPIVVHVMHDGGAVGSAYNPSDADIIAMISTLNDIYASTVTGWPGVNNGGVDMKLRFKLATKDENCNPTTGINRIDASGLSGYTTNGVGHNTGGGPNDQTLKNLSRWDNEKYYNIWIYNGIDGYFGLPGTGGVAGYAYLPYFVSPNLDGTVIIARYVTNDPDDVSVLAHELGHGFGLYHTFQGDAGGSTCPTENNCATENDEVCDTDPHQRVPGCPSGTNSCTGNPYGTLSNNIMNYTTCTNRFTPGQKAKVIFNARNYRSNLIHSATAEAIPSATMTAACTPNSINNPNNFRNIGPREVELEQIYYQSGGYGTDGNAPYLDNTCHSQTKLEAGQTYTLRVQTGGNLAQKVVAFIDYNNDGIFATTERILLNTASSGGNVDHIASFTVPTTAVGCTPLRLRVRADDASSATPNGCSTLDWGQTEDYTILIDNTDTVGIQLSSGTNPSCPGTPLGFTATTNAANPISYVWKLNGTPVATGSTYNTSTAVNGDVLTLEGTTTTLCDATQNIVLTASYTIVRQMNTNVQADLQILLGNDTLCAGESATVLASLQNGSNPSYQWMVNGSPATSTTSSIVYTPADGDYLYCLVTDNNTCFNGTVSSDTITFEVVNQLTAMASIVTSSIFPVCEGENIPFLATVQNEGNNPSYDWLINGVSTGVNALSFSSSSLNNGDVVTFAMSSSITCIDVPTVTSNAINVIINPILPVSVTTNYTQGSNTICNGDPITLQAIPANGGSTPSYEWSLNGVYTGNSNPITFTGVNDGDILSVEMTSSEQCVSGNPATAMETITVFQYPSPIQIWLNGAVLEAYPPTNSYQWYGPNGIINGAVSYNYTPTMNGQYYCIPSNPPCIGDTSNVLDVVILGNEVLVATSEIQVYPNPAKSELTVVLEQDKPVQFYALNTLGQQVNIDFQQISQKEYRLDVSSLEDGLYMLAIVLEGQGIQYTKMHISK